MRFRNYLCFFMIYFSCSAYAYAVENAFYILRFKTADRVVSPDESMKSLIENYKKIDVLIPQAYYINKEGIVKGEVQLEILNFAKQHKMNIMPLVTNSDFNKKDTHYFLTNHTLQVQAINELISLCKKYHFYGMQIDFEMIDVTDRDNLTYFYQSAANAFHKEGLKISFAIAPVVTDKPESAFLKKLYRVWQGAYDIKELGKAADFLSIMSYNQHIGRTTPGTTASYEWMEQVINYTLQYVPAEKISLGIPFYSTYWRTDESKDGYITVKMGAIGYEKALNLIKENNGKVLWDDKAKIHFSIFLRHWLNEFVFIEDSDSFGAKYELVKKHKLRGISVFDLGDEDPRVWLILNK